MDPNSDRPGEPGGAARTLEELTRPMLATLQAMTGYDSVYLTTIDAAAGLQHILYSTNAQQLRIPEGLAVPWADTLCRRALESGRMATTDVASLWPDSGAARALGIQSYVSTPVNAGEQLYGTLCAASTQSLPLSEQAQQLLQSFATLIGQQVEREALLAQLRQANAELSSHALTDPLTGLPNRRALLAELARALARGQREGSLVHVAFVDLDGFKAINDGHGHEVGDEFLAAVSARLAAALRGGDFLGRYGGDEFLVIAASADGTAVAPLRERLAAATRGHYALSGVSLDYPGASVGVATAAPGDSSDVVLARADEAMYAVKRARRQGVTLA
jgi:diguanylate cyclase